MTEDWAATSSAISIKRIWKFPGNAVKGTDISCNFQKHFISPLLLFSLGGKKGEGEREYHITIKWNMNEPPKFKVETSAICA